ncbi:MAG: hypothetical protein KDB22_22170 [Planctomycetales bacterium]|nr:hypothetical protein [Planctomycetales bacterium]
MEKAWNRCASKSWRLAGDLAIAYNAAGEMQKAKEMWQFIKDSNATPDQRDEMQRLLTAYHESSWGKPKVN